MLTAGLSTSQRETTQRRSPLIAPLRSDDAPLCSPLQLAVTSKLHTPRRPVMCVFCACFTGRRKGT